MHSRFDIYITGTFEAGTDSESAIQSYANLTDITLDVAREQFTKAPVCVLDDASADEADSLQQQLGLLGIRTVRRGAGSELLSPVTGPALDGVASNEGDSSGLSSGPPPGSSSDPSAAGPEQAGRQIKTFTFSGKGFEYFRIWIVNLVLTVVTLGLYSPWARIRSRRYFYGNTTLDGASFDYDPNPWRMLVGRVIAVILFGVYYWLGIVSPEIGALAGFVFMLISPWAINKSLAFNARYTRYRNIRFRFDGTYNEALVAFLVWPMAAAISFGILVPVMMQRMQRFVTIHHRYGNKGFNFSATSGQYYRLFFAVIGILLGTGITAMLVGQIDPLPVLIGLGGYALAIVFYNTRLHNLIYNHSSLASNNFRANYELRSYGWLMVSNVVLIVLTLGLYLPFAKIRVAQYKSEHIALDVAGDLDNFVAMSAEEQSAFGEEFSDVFDLDIGF